MEDMKIAKMVEDLAHQVLVMEEEIDELRRENEELKMRLEKSEGHGMKSAR